MTTASVDKAKRQIDAIMAGYQNAAGVSQQSIFSSNVSAGKVYEAWVLCEILARLHVDERCSVRLRGGSSVSLKSSPGPVNRAYSHFEIGHASETLEVWTDVEFLTLSYADRNPPWPSRGDYHELDLVVVPTGSVGRPQHDEIRIGVECKHTPYRKELLRAILGVRRELSYLAPAHPTGFAVWPAPDVPASPASCLLVYCSGPAVLKFAEPGQTFGIDFVHWPLP